MEELHTDSIDGGHEASYGARSRARERVYSNICNRKALSEPPFPRLVGTSLEIGRVISISFI
jgi:hypothetical protein